MWYNRTGSKKHSQGFKAVQHHHLKRTGGRHPLRSVSTLGGLLLRSLTDTSSVAKGRRRNVKQKGEVWRTHPKQLLKTHFSRMSLRVFASIWLIPLHLSNPKGHCLQSLDLMKGIVGPEGSLAHCGPHSGASAPSLWPVGCLDKCQPMLQTMS